MPSFVAPCPRGHTGNFVTVWGYHICFCGLHIPVFVEEIEGPYTNTSTGNPQEITDEPNTLEEMESRIKQGIEDGVDNAINDAWRQEDEHYQERIEELEERLMIVDPEFDR